MKKILRVSHFNNGFKLQTSKVGRIFKKTSLELIKTVKMYLDKDAVLRILKSLEDVKPSARAQSEMRLSSRLSNNQFNQYTRVKGKNTPVPGFLKTRPVTPNPVRKLGIIRNKYKPTDDNLEKALLKHSLWSNQINGFVSSKS